METPQGVAPKAYAIFRNSHLTLENWKALERMLEKIMDDCMGNALYNAILEKLDGKKIIFEFDPKPDGGGMFNIEESRITLQSFESNILLHEMFHVYQAYGETLESFMASVINQEIEAWYAQYLYVSKLPEYTIPDNKWKEIYTNSRIGYSIMKLEEYVDSKGNLIQGVIEIGLDNYLLNAPVQEFRKMSTYNKHFYDHDRNGLQNFKNINKLTKDC